MRLLSGLLLSLTSPFIFADVTVSIPSNVEVLVVNESKPQLNSRLFSSESNLVLDNGSHQVVFRVQQSFSRGNDKELFTSQPVIGTFSANDAQLLIEIPNFKTSRQAEAFNDEPEWQLVDEQGQAIAVKQDRLVHNGMQIGRNFIKESQAYNQTAAVAVWGGAVASASTKTANLAIDSPVDTTDAVVSSADANTAEEMLHFWYQKADPETQQRFRDAINQKAGNQKAVKNQ
jgi:uncharacterized protein YccT (UPF0319 family)